MALKGELIENFKLLTAETCTEEWVNNVWENYFTSYDGLDQTLDPETLIEVLKSLTSGLNGFVGQSSEDEEGLWTVLVENDVSIKAIIAFLGYLMSEGHKKKNASLHERELSITATQVYLKLLMVPNSGVFKTFNPVPYEHGVDYLKLYTSQAGESNKTKKKRGSGKLSIQSRNKSRSRSKDASKDCSLDDDEEEVEEMSDHEISRLRKMLYALLQDVVTLLGTLSMKSESSSACHTIQTLVKLVEVEVETFKCDFTSSTRQDRLSIPALAYKGLESLCSPLHCDKNTLINVMCKQLLPSLIMVGGDGGTNKQQHTIQNQATAFICHLVEKLGTQCIASFRSLVQHMCTKVPDKADYRSSAVQAVVIILQSLPVNIYNGLVHWIDNKLAKHKEVSNRGFAVEVVSALLELPVRQPTADVPNQAPILTHKSLIRTLVDCCSDVAPVVRARAIACFAQCLSSVDDHVAGALRDIVTPAMAQRPLGPVRLIRTPGGSESAQSTLNEEGSSRSEVTIAQQTVENSTTVTTETGQDQDEGQQKRGATPLSAVHLTPGFNPNLTDSEGTFSMLRRRARDDKVHVRKAALYSLECAVNFEGHNYTKQNVEVLKEHCRDPGLSARKQAMQSLTELLTSRIEDTFIQEKWLTGVLPLAMDREQTLADKCMELLEDLLLNNIVPYNRSNAAPHKLAWSMLTIISKPECDGHRRYLLKACRHWGRKGKIKSFVISSLESHFGTENNTGALMLLAEMIPSHSKVSSGFIQQCWTKSQDSGDPHDMLRVMKIMSNAAKHQQTEELEILIADLTSQLQDYKLSPNLIPAAISALSKLCEVHAEKNNLRKPKQWDWCIKLLASTDKYLSNDILKDPETPKNEDLVVAHLSTLGEVAQLCPGKVTKRARLLVLSIIAKPCITSVPSSQPPALDQGDNDQESTQGSQSSQGSQQTQSSQSTQPISQFRNSSWSSLVKAVAFTTLGKLCLQNEKLTKKCVAALARELEVSTDPMIRNNVMTVMCDLCVRYTTTANEYVGTIASCLKDPILLVRQQALTMITKLLQQDFLKWKGALFYRYIATVVDEDEDLADFAKTCLVVLLIKPNPNLFFQHFVECLFHFNDYQHHNTYNRFPQIDRDRELFTLKGEKNSKKRHDLYKFLLQTMVDEHKFKLQTKLGHDILNAVVEGVLPLNEETKPILKDALVILSSKGSSKREHRLREIQLILDDPVITVKELHSVRWLSYFNALQSIYRLLDSLLTYLQEAATDGKDPKAVGLKKKVGNDKFLAITYMMMDAMSPVTAISQFFQTENVDIALVKVKVDLCISDLEKVKGLETPYMQELSKDLEGNSFKGHHIIKSPLFDIQALAASFIDTLQSNIKKRFPENEMLQAFGALEMRPISFLSKEDSAEWGINEIKQLGEHYGATKEVTWEDENRNKVSESSDPVIDSEKCLEEWGLVKEVVLAEHYPRDSMSSLWQLIAKYHMTEFPNLIKLAQLALTSAVHTAGCERGFSAQNAILTKGRNRLLVENQHKLMRVKMSSSIDYEQEIKLTVLRNQTASDPDMDVQEKAAHIAKKFIITQIVKKNMVEEIIPKVVDLKQMLVKQRSPLLKEVMLYLLELNRDYKKEIQEIADHQLVAEIEFDLRKFEEQQQLEAREQNVTPAIQGSPVASGPQPSPRPGSASPAVRSPARKMPSTPPRSPGMRSPAARSPLVQAGSPKPCTPHRKPPNSVSRVAMLNSARRAMEKNKTTPRAPLPAIDQSNESRRVSFETNDSSKNGKAATPKDTRNLYRAISTPSAAMTDITFNGDGNMTFLPPSPIQETAPIQRMFDESNYRLSNEMEESEEEPLVVCIDMPAEALTPAKVVTRTSPEPQSNKEGRVSIGNEELNPTPLATIQPDTANQRRASTRKSQSKDSPKPAAADQRRASTRKSLSKDLQHPKDQPTDNIESQKAKLKKGRKRKL